MMKSQWSVSQIVPMILSVFTVGLIILLLVGSFHSADRSNNAIKEIDQVHFPVLEDLAVGSRLQQSLDFLLELSIQSRDPKYIGEYELARGLLIETTNRVNQLVLKNSKALGDLPHIERKYLTDFEEQFLDLLSQGKFETLVRLKSSEEYLELKTSFSEKMFSTVQAVSEKRERELVAQQETLSREYWMGGVIVGLVSVLLIVILTLWTHVSHKSQELEFRAQNNARLAALGEMAGGVAHEINNPLAIIDGSVDMCLREIQRDGFDHEKVFKRLNKVRETVQRITKIVKGLKRFSREPDSDEMQMHSLLKVVNESLDLSREKIKHLGVDVKINIPANLEICCNQTEFSQVIINLVNNSIDEIKGEKDPWIRIEYNSSSQGAMLSITDSGKGIPMDLVKNIMRPFFSTKGIGEGTGLGLSISHGIIKRHGGDLVVDQQSTNTKFDIILPEAIKVKEVA